MELSDFLAQVLDNIHDFGGLSWIGKVAIIVALLIGSMKVTALNNLLWNKLGKFKAWLAPVLGLVGGVLSLIASGTPLTLASLMAYMSAGAGAVILVELLEMVKIIPGIGPIWLSLIDVLEKVLGGQKKPELPPSA